MAEVKRLAQCVTPIHAERNDLILKRGDRCDGIHSIVYGRVCLSMTSGRGSEKPLYIIESGRSFGDTAMFLQQPFYLNARAMEDCMLIYVPRQAILDMIEHDSHFALRMLASMSARLGHVVTDIEEFMLQPPAARVVTYLLRMLPPGSMHSAKIELSIKKNVVAAQLNLTPETLSRYFKEMVDMGLITLQGRTILVHDIDKLGNYVTSVLSN